MAERPEQRSQRNTTGDSGSKYEDFESAELVNRRMDRLKRKAMLKSHPVVTEDEDSSSSSESHFSKNDGVSKSSQSRDPPNYRKKPPSIRSKASNKSLKKMQSDLEVDEELSKMDLNLKRQEMEVDLRRKEMEVEFMRQENEAKMKLLLKKKELQQAQIELSDDDDERQEEDGSIFLSCTAQTKKWVDAQPESRSNNSEDERENRLLQDRLDKLLTEPLTTSVADDKPKLTDDVAAAPAQSTLETILMKLVEGQAKSQAVDTSKFLARQSHAKDLPFYDGRPDHWSLFISEYERTTEICGYSDSENVTRLRKCLKGEAFESVSFLLVSPNNLGKIIEVLRIRFGDDDVIIKSLICRAKEVPAPKEDKPETLVKFGTAVQTLVATMQIMDRVDHLGNPQLLDELASKLPFTLRYQWVEWVQAVDQRKHNLLSFSNWLEKKTRAACKMLIPRPSHDWQEKKFHPRVKEVHHASMDEAEEPEEQEAPKADKKQWKCFLCDQVGHGVDDCRSFKLSTLESRWKLVKDRKLCFLCLRVGHQTTKCRSKARCGKDGCELKHHRLLHKGETMVTAVDMINDEHIGTVFSANDESQVLLRIMPVVLTGSKGSLKTYALLDEGATVSLLDDAMARKLGLDGRVAPLCIHTVGSSEEQHGSKKVEVRISGTAKGAKGFVLRNVRTIKNLPLASQTVNAEEMKMKWSHLRSVPFESMKDAKPTILIGSDNLKLTTPREMLSGSWNSPVATKNPLGWVVAGNSNKSRSSQSEYSFFICDAGDKCKQHQVDMDADRVIRESFSTEAFGVRVTHAKIRSNEDERAASIQQNTTKRVGERFQTGLLWKTKDVRLPESKNNALMRLKCIERKLDKDFKYAEQYCEKIADYEKKGYIQKLNPAKSASTMNRDWYLPHFAVFNPQKPGKLRLVFDAAALSKGTSLNDNVMKGPDLLNPLPAVLWKFRQHVIGFTADIREMFHQVKIQPEDQNSQRFLWRGMNRNKEPDVYQMNVMIFGCASSPSSALYVKQLNAKENETEYPEAFKAIHERHYMDDYLDGAKTTAAALNLINDVSFVHAKGGFEIVNWMCSSKEVMDKIPVDQRAKEWKDIDSTSELPTERILGMYWNADEDAFTFNLKFHKVDPDIVDGSRRPSKRDILKLTMSVFDPLGFVSHFTVKARILLQDIWRCGLGWDDEVTDAHYAKWKIWLEELKSIVNVRIPRCYHGSVDACLSRQLHVFCDASEQAFSSVAYFRFEDMFGVKTAFVDSKTRVAPLRPMSIPRLELQAALMGSRLAACIKKEHEFRIDRVVFWSDSRTVLCWLRSDARRYKQFVAHRVGEIMELTNIPDWRWVPTGHNVSDEATRDNKSSEFGSESRWWSGPEFLKEAEHFWPLEHKQSVAEIENNFAMESKEEMVFNIVDAEQKTDILPRLERFSSFHRLLRATVWFKRSCDAFKRGKDKPSFTRELYPVDIDDAERFLVKQAQDQTFHNELETLKKGGTVTKTSRLYRLSPGLDKHGVLILRGRIEKNRSIQVSLNNPMILDGRHRLTELLIAYQHKKSGHIGREQILNDLREKYWILGARGAVRKVWNNCEFCKIKRSKVAFPEMGQIPAFRLNPTERPFVMTGVDYFGPMEVTIGRKRVKRYGVIFTCLVTRAVHLEIAHSLDTDSAIMALRRMMARRGSPRKIFSDNGTNFHGAESVLRETLQQWDQSKIIQEMTVKGVEWIFNPPSAPHMGGIWERLVRSVKIAIKAILNEQAPSEESLQTLFSEAENMVNSRPLTFVSLDPSDPESLTPNHFLIGKQCFISAPGEFEDRDLFLRRQWRYSQRLSDHFWKRWLREYLPTLARRTKWHQKTNPIKVGDLVIVVEENGPRNNWPKGIVEDVFPGKDGVVRVVDVRTKSGRYRRPVAKLIPLDVKRVDLGDPSSKIVGEDVRGN